MPLGSRGPPHHVSQHGAGTVGRKGTMMGEEPRQQEELAAQLETATEAIRAALLRLLHDGETHPQLIVLAAATVVGELGAFMALAGGQDLEPLLSELAEVV